MAKTKVEATFDEMGQESGTKKGPANPDAISQMIPDAPEREASTDEPVLVDKAQLVEMFKDFAATAEGKALLGIPDTPQQAMANLERNYAGEAALRVTGGLEVEHPANFRALPPEFIKRYEAEGGGKTDYIDGLMGKDADGNEVQMRAPARRDLEGHPVLTASYAHWLLLKSQGKRISGKVATDMAHDKFVDEGVNIE